MGQIIIKVPGDIQEVIEINNKEDLEKAKKLIEELEKENIYSSFLDKYLGKVNIKNIDEESLYLQED